MLDLGIIIESCFIQDLVYGFPFLLVYCQCIMINSQDNEASVDGPVTNAISPFMTRLDCCVVLLSALSLVAHRPIGFRNRIGQHAVRITCVARRLTTA